VVAPPRFFQNGEEESLNAVIVEQRSALVTTTCDEVRSIDVVTTFEAGGHESRLEESSVSVGDGEHN
jgi:hypothetical protein